MVNQLVKIESENWGHLKSIYLPETSETILGLGTVNNYIRWKEYDDTRIDKNFAVYSLNGDWTDGTFAVVDRYHLYFDSLGDTGERLMQLLQLLDYSKGFRIMHVRLRHYPIILEIIKQMNLQLEYDDVNVLYYLPQEKAITIDVRVPEGFYSQSLTNEDVVKANESWPFSHPGSLYYLKRLARFNASCGIFTCQGSEMVSSVFQFQTGVIGTLRTDIKYQRRGLGRAVVKTISKRVAESGIGVAACVKRMNAESCAIFEKIGFKTIDEVHWIATEPCNWIEEEEES